MKTCIRHFTISCVTAAAVLALCAPGARAQHSQFFDEFSDNYNILGIDLLNQTVEVAEVKDFVYHKDIASFTFTEGKMYLARPIMGRPTTAIFIGKGHAHIDVPSHVERQGLAYVSRDTVVDVDFTVAAIRMSDDFDLRLREKFTFSQTTMGWRSYNTMQKQKAELFFDPRVMHEYDNYFELMRSAYKRTADGYFWIDFGRFSFTFDPALPEEVIVGYELEQGNIAMTTAAKLQRQERGIVDDTAMSHISYPTTCVSREGTLVMRGLDGKYVDTAGVTARFVINRDSLRFVSLFLHYNLTLDSLFVDGQPGEYWRRKDFGHIGLILPQYRHRGDTLTVTFWYHGKDYTSMLPFVADPSPSRLHLIFTTFANYNYVAPGAQPLAPLRQGTERFLLAPEQPYRTFVFQPYATGFDTIPDIAAGTLPVMFLKSRHLTKTLFECFVPDTKYHPPVLGALNFLAPRLGPPEADTIWVYPEGDKSMPGLMEVPQVLCYQDETGGLYAIAGREAGRQWFGSLTRPASDREFWLLDALPDYLGLLVVRSELDPGVFFGELQRRKDVIDRALDLHYDQPLGTGARVNSDLRTTKGVWLLHMLRILMYDETKNSDRTFWKFIRDLNQLVNHHSFTNGDIIRLAEKHYGGTLDWFFRQWLFGRLIPKYEVKYSIGKKDGGFMIAGKVDCKGVSKDYAMPVLMRVNFEDGTTTLVRQTVKDGSQLALGPFPIKPKELIFNELFSVLCDAKVKKK